jgi:phosphatidylglycerophosphate synthase
MLAQNRRLYEKMSESVGKLGAALGLSPNFWTLAGLGLSVVAAGLLANRLLGWTLLVLLLMTLTDVMDGATARATGRISKFGGVLDHVTDRYAELFIAGGVMLSGLAHPIWVLFGIAGALMASYVRGKAESVAGLANANVGWAGRQEKGYILVAGMLVEMMHIGPGALQWAFILIGIVSHLTAIQRLVYVYRATASSE